MWMLGCVLYELAAKEKPFQGDSLNVYFNYFRQLFII